MNKIEQASEILKALGLPKEQQNEMSAMTLLALCGIKEKDSWVKSARKSLGVSKGIMNFLKRNIVKNMHQIREKLLEDTYYINLFKPE